jgi:hypothetical protein
VPRTPFAASYPAIRTDLMEVNAEGASRASMHGWRLLETLEAVSAEKKHACYGECFV